MRACVCFRYFANEPFADLHRVEGLRGVFVATLINGSLREDNMRSVITFDKGGTWELLQSPSSDSLGGSIDCQVAQTQTPQERLELPVCHGVVSECERECSYCWRKW